MKKTVDRAWLLRELNSSLRSLAAPGSQALAAQPDGVAKADELALDYQSFVQAVLGNFGGELTEAQRAALLAVDDLMLAMSGAEQAELWTEEAVCHHPRWAEVRAAAGAALELLGWSTA